MSPALATTIGTALYAVALLPVVAAAFWGNVRKILVPYVAAIIVLVAVQTGVFHGSSLAPTDVVVRVSASADDEQCKQVLELMQQSGVSIDRSDLASPKIVGSGVEQIPLEVRNVLLACSEQANATDQNRQADEPE